MPTYQYYCLNCGYRFNKIYRYDEQRLPKCDNCGHTEIAQSYTSTSTPIIFKAKDFYSSNNSKNK